MGLNAFWFVAELFGFAYVLVFVGLVVLDLFVLTWCDLVWSFLLSFSFVIRFCIWFVIYV